ncbi:hypothetical protein M3J09_000168 [Ascochyta lentis]
MSYAALPPSPRLEQNHDDQNIADRETRYSSGLSPLDRPSRHSFLGSSTERASIDSEGHSVSTQRDTDPIVPAIHPGSHLLQDADDHRPHYDPSNATAAVFPTSTSAGSGLHATGTQASLEMQDLDQSNELKLTRPRTSLGQLMQTWRWEIFTWVLGTVGYLSNLILVCISDGMLQKNWHSRIQITAFVAALAQVSQSALLVPTASSIAQLKWKWVLTASRPAQDIDRFDLASRGPDGSMRLLWYFALKQNLASLGALATILLLAFPTFVQQAVQIGTTNFQNTGAEFASLPRATQYLSDGDLGGSNNAFFDQARLDTWFRSDYMDVYLKSAVEAGLLAADVTPDDVASHCGTEACSWEPYHTLAICSGVEDADHMLSFEDGAVPRVPLGGDDIPQGRKKIQPESTFRAESKFFAADRYEGSTDANYTKLVRSRPTPNNTETNLPDLAHVYLTYFDPCLGTNNIAGRKDRKGWKAHKATFNLCIQTHNTSYNASGMHTTILSNNEKINWSNETVVEYDGSTVPYMWKNYCAQLPNSTERFCLADRVMVLLGGQLALTLNTTAYWGGQGDHYYVYSLWAPNLGSDVLGRDPGVCSTDESRGIKGYEHRISNIATSLTNAFRTANSSTAVTGTAYTTEPTIEVNYMWLIFPNVLYLVISGFFLATLIQTRDLPSWKSSALALLWCKEPGDNHLLTPNQMKTRVKQARVQLLYGRDTWQLAET